MKTIVDKVKKKDLIDKEIKDCSAQKIILKICFSFFFFGWKKQIIVQNEDYVIHNLLPENLQCGKLSL